MTRVAGNSLLKPSKGHVIGESELMSLEKLIMKCTQAKATWGLVQNDIVFALAFWSMVKCGFQCAPSENVKTTQNEQISDEETLPEGWKHETRQIYEARFFLPPFSDFPVKLVALPADDILCINVMAKNVSTKNVSLKTLAIYSPGYVPRPEEDIITSKFSDLADFQFLLKNVIIWPIRCSILTEQGIANGSLCGLSDEIQLKIIRQLPIKDVLLLSQTCRRLNRICNDQSLWKIFFHDYFKCLCKCATESKMCNEVKDWKENFKQTYIQERDEENCYDSRASSPEFFDSSEIDFDIS